MIVLILQKLCNLTGHSSCRKNKFKIASETERKFNSALSYLCDFLLYCLIKGDRGIAFLFCMILIKVQMLTCLTGKADDLCTVTGQKAKHLCYQKGRSQNLLPLLAIGIDLYFLRNSLCVFLLQRQISTRNGSDKTLYKVCVGGGWGGSDPSLGRQT